MSGHEQRIRPIFLYLLSFIGFATVIFSSIGSNIESIPVDLPLGLFNLLPIGYWAGLAIMLISLGFGMKNRSEGLFLVQALLIFVALWGASSLFQQIPPVWDNYTHYYYSEQIALSGFVSSSSTFAYSFNYPGYYALIASFIVMAQPSALLVLKLYPLFAAALTISAIYLFVRTYIPKIGYREAFLIAAFANVWFQFNVSPQSIGFAVGLLILVCLEREGINWRAMALLLFAFIVVAHPTTVIFILGAVVLKEVIGRSWRYLSKNKRPEALDKPWPIGYLLLIWLGWYFTGAISYSGSLISFFEARLGDFFSIGTSVSSTIQTRSAGNIFGAFASDIRTLTLVVFILLAIIAIIVYLVYRKEKTGSLSKELACFIGHLIHNDPT